MTDNRAAAAPLQSLSLNTPAWSALPLRFLGMGFYLAWIYSVQFGSASSPTPLDVALPEPLSLLSNVANATALILCAIFARQLTPLVQKRPVAWLAGIAMALSTLLLGLNGATSLVVNESFMANFGIIAEMANIIGAVVSGLGLGIVILLWGEFYASLPLRLVMIYYSASFIVATLLNFLILALGGWPALFVAALLPIMSVGCCMGSVQLRNQQLAPLNQSDITHPKSTHKDQDDTSKNNDTLNESFERSAKTSDLDSIDTDGLSQKTVRLAAAARSEATSQAQRIAETRWTFPLRPVLLMAAYSFAFSYCRASGSVVNALPMIGVAAIAAFTLIGSLWLFDRFRINLLYRLALPLMVAGILLQPFGGYLGTVIAGIFLNAGHAGFVILVMILFSTMCYRYGILALWLFGITRAARVIAMVLGSSFGMNFPQHVGAEGIALASALIAVGLVALSTLLITEKDMESTWGITPIIPETPGVAAKTETATQTDYASEKVCEATNEIAGEKDYAAKTHAVKTPDEPLPHASEKSPTSAPGTMSDFGTAQTPTSPLAGSSASSPTPSAGVTAAATATTTNASVGNYFDTFVGRCAQIARIHGLTPREEEVLALLAQGYSVPRIEKELFISNGTAKGHVRHIYAKMGVHTRDELIEAVGTNG